MVGKPRRKHPVQCRCQQSALLRMQRRSAVDGTTGRSAFKGVDHFYNVAFHELTHWTAHKSRLDRNLKNRSDSRNYAAEELIAELGAAFLCAEFAFEGDVRNSGYIGPWVELLKADKRAFFTACSQASKAAEYLRGLALAEPAERAA
jgi:antirestriction protein ArdC